MNSSLKLLRQFAKLLPLLNSDEMGANLKWMIDYREDFMRRQRAGITKENAMDQAAAAKNQQIVLALWPTYDDNHKVALMTLIKQYNGSNEADAVNAKYPGAINNYTVGGGGYADTVGYQTQFYSEIDATLSAQGYDFHLGKHKQDQHGKHPRGK